MAAQNVTGIRERLPPTLSQWQKHCKASYSLKQGDLVCNGRENVIGIFGLESNVLHFGLKC